VASSERRSSALADRRQLRPRQKPTAWASSASTSASRFVAGGDWVFATGRGTPHGHRDVTRRNLGRAAALAGLNPDGWPPLRFHDLRHTFASHLIIDLGLDVAQTSRILGHARVTITLDIDTHLFDDARHARDIRIRVSESTFAQLLDPPTPRSPDTAPVKFAALSCAAPSIPRGREISTMTNASLGSATTPSFRASRSVAGPVAARFGRGPASLPAAVNSGVPAASAHPVGLGATARVSAGSGAPACVSACATSAPGLVRRFRGKPRRQRRCASRQELTVDVGPTKRTEERRRS
jgi:hypothetical protein